MESIIEKDCIESMLLIRDKGVARLGASAVDKPDLKQLKDAIAFKRCKQTLNCLGFAVKEVLLSKVFSKGRISKTLDLANFANAPPPTNSTTGS